MPGDACESVKHLEDQVRFGAMVRAMHYWSANTLIVIGMATYIPLVGDLLREVVTAYPEQSEASYSLGLLLAEMGRSEEAERFLAAAASGMTGNARVHYNHGLLLAGLGRDDEAERSLGRALEIKARAGGR